MKYADVILPRKLTDPLTYQIPEALSATIAPGSRVVVPLQTKLYTGIVLQVHERRPEFKLKKVVGVVDSAPVVTQGQLQLWQWMAGYYICTLGEVMTAALPAGLKLQSETLVCRADGGDDTMHPTGEKDAQSTPLEKKILAALSETKPMMIKQLQQAVGCGEILTHVRRLVERGCVVVEEQLGRRFAPKTEVRLRLASAFFDEGRLNEALDSLKRASKQQRALLAYLDAAGAPAALNLRNAALLMEVSRAEIRKRTADDGAALTALCKKGILEQYDVAIGRLKSFKALPERLQPQLSSLQKQALTEIKIAFSQRDTCLLHGVTSSGKTAVYIELIKNVLAEGKQVLYLLPEIALTTQLMQRLGRVFGEKMGVYHSKFPDNERVETWLRQLSSEPFPLILGVRSALLLPFQNLGLIIVDEEHEASYKQQDPAPRYHARDTALVLAQRCGAKVLLGTATPAVETYYNVQKGKFGLVELHQRFGDLQMPQILVEDVGELRRKKLMKTPFAPRLIEEMARAIERREQVILFQNRRGYAPVLVCDTCGWTPRCTCCDVALTYHQRQQRLVCHYCGKTYDVPTQCPNCGSKKLLDLGLGTEKVEAAVKAILPEARTARLDLDTTSTRSAYERIIADFAAGGKDVLIGTQMVTKGLDFDRVHVVGIINADQLLSTPDFRAHERAYQLMTQVAGRAGRRDERGLVILQTRQPELSLMHQVVTHDYKAMYREQLAEREAFDYPPFVRLIIVCFKHRQEAVVAHAAEAFTNSLRAAFGEHLLGPDRPPVGRVQLQFIRRLMIKAPISYPVSGVRRTLLAARNLLLSQAAFRGVNVYFDVDPL